MRLHSRAQHKACTVGHALLPWPAELRQTTAERQQAEPPALQGRKGGH